MDREDRFRAVFRVAYPALHRYGRHRGLSQTDAEDLAAATLEIAWRRLEELPADEPLPWLFAVARNLSRNERRSRDRRRLLVARIAGETAVGSVPEPVDLRRVRAALDALSDDDRELILLVAWDGLSPGQAAKVLGCSGVAARTRLHRARRRIAARLELTTRMQRSATSEQKSHVMSPIACREAVDG